MLVLELFGTLSLRSDSRPVPVAAQQKRPLGLLAILALGGTQGVVRDRVEAYLWPESSGALARHSLDQTVYALRRALGADVILSAGRELRLNPALFDVDLWGFGEAIRARHWAEAAARYKGPLLEGVHLANSRELEQLIDMERARCVEEYRGAVERLADDATSAGDHIAGVAWSRRLTNSDPLSARATKRLMRALAASGDRVGAVRHARLYQELMRQDLEMEPDPEIEAMASAFSRASNGEGTGAPLSRRPPFVVPTPSSDTATPTTAAGTAGASTDRETPTRPRIRRSRPVAMLSVSALLVLLIGAAAIGTRQQRGQRLTLSGHEARGNQIAPLPQPRDSYVRALDAWRDGSKRGLDSAVMHFHHAIALDPDYAEAYAGLANAYVMIAYFGYAPSVAVMPRAKEAALRSMRLDSTLVSAHPALAYELAWERDFVGADTEFRKAVALDPTHAPAQATAADPTQVPANQWYSILLMILSQSTESVAATPRPATPDPFSLHVPVVEVPFTKWITDYPGMAGSTSYGPGTLAGEVLSRIDEGAATHLVARYEITDPAGTHSFKAVIQGKDDSEGRFDLNGIVTWGWMTGAKVHVTFQRISPCGHGTRNVCFQGIIQIQRG
jgi:DNA-binding SARP family transcriptional activator